MNDPDFIRYLQHENSYADAFMKDTSEIQRTLYFEMLGRMPAKISTPPERWGPWYAYFHVYSFSYVSVYSNLLLYMHEIF